MPRPTLRKALVSDQSTETEAFSSTLQVVEKSPNTIAASDGDLRMDVELLVDPLKVPVGEIHLETVDVTALRKPCGPGLVLVSGDDGPHPVRLVPPASAGSSASKASSSTNPLEETR